MPRRTAVHLPRTFGQTYYFETPRVIAARGGAGHRQALGPRRAAGPHRLPGLERGLGVQWDPQNQRSERTIVNLQYKPAAERSSTSPTATSVPSTSVEPRAPGRSAVTATRSSRGRCSRVDQASSSAADAGALGIFARTRPGASTPHGRSWSVSPASSTVRCCWRVRPRGAPLRQQPRPERRPDTGVWLQLELAGLASVGSASDASLSEEIRGYTPPAARQSRLQGPLKGIW